MFTDEGEGRNVLASTTVLNVGIPSTAETLFVSYTVSLNDYIHVHLYIKNSLIYMSI